MTLTYELDINIPNMCLHTKNEVSRLILPKVTAQTNFTTLKSLDYNVVMTFRFNNNNTPYITAVSYVGGPGAHIPKRPLSQKTRK